MPSILALDFDGVLCNSARELGLSAWRAGASIWSDWADAPPGEALLQRFDQVRPVLETGYQALPLMRLLQKHSDNASILQNAETMISEEMAAVGRDKSALNERLMAARQSWIDADRADWLAAHEFYPGTIEAVKRALGAGTEVYIITTKQEAFTRQLLAAQGVEIPADRVYALEKIDQLGGKPGVLASLLQAHSGAPIVFVEDRLETLEAVRARPDLDAVRTYLVDWGFNTAETRARAAELARIEVIGLADFPPLS